MNSGHLIIIILILILIRECSSSPDDELYGTCKSSFSCGNIQGFRYPFRRHQDPAYCGYPGFELNCNEQNPPTINIMNITYQILSTDPTAQIMKIVREDMVDLTCPQNLVNTSIDHNIFSYTSSYMNITFLYGCPVPSSITGIDSVFCDYTNGFHPVFVLKGAQGPGSCKNSIMVPVTVGFLNRTQLDPIELGYVVRQGIEVRWNVGLKPCSDCMQSGGQCMYDNATRLTSCACPEIPFLADRCSAANKNTSISLSPSSGK